MTYLLVRPCNILFHVQHLFLVLSKSLYSHRKIEIRICFKYKKSNHKFIYSVKLIPNGDKQAFLSISPFRGNLTVPTEPVWCDDDRSIYSIKLIPNGANEAFLSI